jgi:hypothetical protein
VRSKLKCLAGTVSVALTVSSCSVALDAVHASCIPSSTAVYITIFIAVRVGRNCGEGGTPEWRAHSIRAKSAALGNSERNERRKEMNRSHSTLMFAALMIGHHFSISALW